MTPLRGLSWALSSPCSRASWTGSASHILRGQTEDSMILLESKDFALSLLISFLPLTFWQKNWTLTHSREPLRGLMLAGQPETLPGRDDSWMVKSWMALWSTFSNSLGPPSYSFSLKSTINLFCMNCQGRSCIVPLSSGSFHSSSNQGSVLPLWSPHS